MAYSNWGAFVHKDGERRTDRENVAVFNDDEKDAPSDARIFANILKNRAKYPDGNPPWHEGSQHAVLGDGPVRLVGYMSHPSLYELTDDGEVIDVDLKPYRTRGDDEDYGENTEYKGEYKGYWFAAHEFDGNMLDLELTEPDGATWASRCGYRFGARHMDDPA